MTTITTSSTEAMNLWYLWTDTAATVSHRPMISMTFLPNIYKIPTTLLWNPYDVYTSWYLQGIYNFATRYLWNFYDVYNCYGNYGIYRDSQDLLMLLTWCQSWTQSLLFVQHAQIFFQISWQKVRQLSNLRHKLMQVQVKMSMHVNKSSKVNSLRWSSIS